MPQTFANQTKLLSLVAALPHTADTALHAFQTVTETQSSFLAEGWTAEEIFWCRYFYIRLYANLKSVSDGQDAGLEQTIFQVIESPLPKCEPDWRLLESMDLFAHRIASEWRAHGA